ncbi:MAG TPA: diaminopimelate epimerase [Blastocatellia bacterium]|jgi:diaminopimelate epimerase|nr:diaminopimelate epimerase [Blastocatellia bacterium]
MLFHKFQALGNDFLIVRESALRPSVDDLEVFSKQICDRHFGAGADGVELLLDSPRVAGADFEVRLFNADGGETPISGNGTRCVAAYLYLIEKWERPEVRIATGAGVKVLRPIDRSGSCMVFEAEMGAPRFANEEIPVITTTRLDRVIGQRLDVDGQSVEFTATSMGNPHCGVFVDDFARVDWRALGSKIETHAAFPDRTNVEFIRVINRDEIEARFWERGVGETLASGTGACGAALAAMINGLTAAKVKVITAAGALLVEWRDDGMIVQTGEASAVYRGEWLKG